MTVLCDKKNCRHLIYNLFYEYHCGCDKCIKIKSGKCTSYDKLSIEELKEKRKKAPFKNMY